MINKIISINFKKKLKNLLVELLLLLRYDIFKDFPDLTLNLENISLAI